MNEKKSPFPSEPRQVKDYIVNLTRTDEYLDAQQEMRQQYGEQIKTASPEAKRSLTRLALQGSIAKTAEKVNQQPERHDNVDVSPIYNDILGALPDLNEGLTNLENKTGNPKDNKRKIIPFNHKVKKLINHYPSVSPNQLEHMIQNTALVAHYDSSLADKINKHIIPGMKHELAHESNVYFLPGQPEVIDTTVEDELNGIDYRLQFKNGIEITEDVKKSEEAAIRAQQERDDWRERNHITTPDTHIIIHSGYTKDDFIPNKIGRVTEEARQREQPRIDAAIRQKYAELRQARVSA
ncbi:MAG TPA: hypothetical protein VFM68_03105 [Candidatus Saccharimonadales bacterium]|nr:hypothetical protein [Candidatus Saccharimonadales bacterium]